MPLVSSTLNKIPRQVVFENETDAYANIKINLKTYNKILKRNIEQAKIMYSTKNWLNIQMI